MSSEMRFASMNDFCRLCLFIYRIFIKRLLQVIYPEASSALVYVWSWM